MTNNSYYLGLLTLGCYWIILKQRSYEAWYSFMVGVNSGIEQWDYFTEPDNGICDGTLLCTRQNVRHKADCLGKL